MFSVDTDGVVPCCSRRKPQVTRDAVQWPSALLEVWKKELNDEVVVGKDIYRKAHLSIASLPD